MTSEEKTGKRNSSKSVSNVVFIDADNTLWATDRVFAKAQLFVLGAVERELGMIAVDPKRLDFVREIDQYLARHHHDSFRYPPALLIAGIALRLLGVEVRAAARQALKEGMAACPDIQKKVYAEIVAEYLVRLEAIPPLLPGVRRGLEKLRELDGRLILITEGSKRRVVANLEWHDLSRHFDRVIEGKKDTRLYLRVLRLLGNPDVKIMVGDQYTRDIVPAHEAGLITVHVPGSFVPEWESERKDDVADYRLLEFGGTPSVLTKVLRQVGSQDR